ncbi:hypothetical protein [Vibrio sp. 03_296]|uniref:hypothetical protein n=1 Tax=Vibrio sp. 03_296 TaxID=2024409 RepID=UPI002D7F5B1E|nr:hypothetical protein [Vibrio sp. 03_296]
MASVDANLKDVITSKVFIQNPDNVPAVMEFVGTKFRGVNPTTTVTCPPLGSTIYEVEIEVDCLSRRITGRRRGNRAFKIEAAKGAVSR